jgi:hypothetical protein
VAPQKLRTLAIADVPERCIPRMIIAFRWIFLGRFAVVTTIIT